MREDFHYSSDSEWDHAEAMQISYFHPEWAWVCTDRDVWHVNPYYQGPPQPHPNDDAACEEYARTGVYTPPEPRVAAPPHDDWDDIPF
jgi:hypothetical protein